MLRGRFAQGMEFAAIVVTLLGMAMLCQPFFFPFFKWGFSALLIGWVGLNIFSHRRPVRDDE